MNGRGLFVMAVLLAASAAGAHALFAGSAAMAFHDPAPEDDSHAPRASGRFAGAAQGGGGFAAGTGPGGGVQSLGGKAYQRVSLYPPRPPGDALAYVNQLKVRSNAGDANATYAIYLTIWDCRNVLSEAADGQVEAARRVGAEAQFLATSERLLHECQTLMLDRAVYQGPWLAIAAAQGSEDAMYAYARAPEEVIGPLADTMGEAAATEEWKNTAAGYLQDLANNGNVNGIAGLASAYRYGGAVDVDALLAYAYELTLQRIDPSFTSEDELSERRAVLSLAEQAMARELSGRIYEECCGPATGATLGDGNG